MTADEALAHPYLSSYVRCLFFFIMVARSIRSLKHDPEDEPAATTLDPDYFNFEGMWCNPLCFAFLVSCSSLCASEENESLDKAQLKELLYDEIVSFVPSI
jgi:mitogen-activated protein kinase 1/3